MIQVDRLLQKIERAFLHGRHGFFHRAIGRQQNHRNRRIRLLRFPQHLEPRCSRHLQIRNDEQVSPRAHLLNGCRTVRRFVHVVTRALQGLPQHRAQFVLIFDEEQRFHLFRFYHEC